MKNTIIIPARAGSKRLINKNFLIFNNKTGRTNHCVFKKNKKY